MQYVDLDTLKAELSLDILQQLAPWADGVDEVGGEFFDAQVSDTLLEKLNSVAVGEVHGYVRGIYSVPFSDPADPVVSQTVAELMHYQLYKQRDGSKIPDAVMELYKQAVKRLEKMQKREIVLAADQLSGDETSEPATFRYISPVAKFPANFTKT